MGEARRFGSDKLAADVDGRALLEVALDGLPDDWRVAVVGPPRQLAREVTVLREDPPGGGPAAGLITGLIWALATDVEAIVTLPGDATGGGRAARAAAGRARQPGASMPWSASTDRGVTRCCSSPCGRRPPGSWSSWPGPIGATTSPSGGWWPTLAPARLALPDDLCADIDTVDQLKHFRNLRRT